MSLSHTVSLDAKTFTQKHLEITKMYYNPSVWPGYYDNNEIQKKFKDLKYINRRIVRIEDVVYQIKEEDLAKYPPNIQKHVKENFSYVQPSRHAAAENREELYKDMDENGYELCHKPMVAVQCPDGRIHLNDGRTRLQKLLREGFTHIIVDFYTCTDWHTFSLFGIYNNPKASARSPHKLEDVIALGISEISYGRLVNTEAAVADFIHKTTNNAYKNNSYSFGKMSKGILSKYETRYHTYNNEQCEEWLKSNGYHDDEKNGIYYLVVSSTSKNSAIHTAAKKHSTLVEEGKYVKHIRIVINPEIKTTSDPEGSWIKSVDEFRKTFGNALIDISDSYFGGKYSNKQVVSVHSAIPLVFSMAQEFPMDKLVIFEEVLTTYDTFSEMRTPNGLAALIEQE
jgi:hypothetical protein